jgi:tetratricopeptide (TPR) repeat protein
LDQRTRTLRDMETLNRRPFYLAQFANFLLQHRQPGDKQDLTEAQKLVDQIKLLRPEALGTLVLQVEIHRIRDEVGQAAELIQAFANHPNVGPQVLGRLAGIAEKIKQVPLAEELYQRQAKLAGTTQGKLLWAAFLGRNDRAKDGLDICEPLWMNGNEVRVVSMTSIEILFGSDNTRTPDSMQTDRVAGWFEQAITRAKSQKRSNPWLFTGLGSLRERQGRFSDAAELYRRAIQEDDRDGTSLNNLAWLAALNEDKKRIKEALGYANRAIALKPDQPDFLDTRGMVYLVGDQPTLALEDFQRAVAIDPSSASKHFHLAQAYLANNDKERARQSLDAAKAKGFTPSSLHALEQENCKRVLNALGSS